MKSLLALMLILVPLHAQEGERRLEKRDVEEIVSEQNKTVVYSVKKGARVFLIVFDYSGSMAQRNLININKEALKNFMASHSGNSGFVTGAVAFAGCYSEDGADTPLNGAPPMIKIGFAADNGSNIVRAIDPLAASGGTALAVALRAALKMKKEEEFAEILLYTDFDDTCNGKWQHLVKELQEKYMTVTETRTERRIESRVRINVMTENASRARTTLHRLAEITHGKYLVGQEEQEAFYRQIEDEEAKGQLNIVTASEEVEDANEARQELRQEKRTTEEEKQLERERQKQRSVTPKKRNQ